MWELIITLIILMNQGVTPKASYYNDSFDGKITASGEVFDQSKFTAASPYFPFGTIVLITNSNNNMQCVVRINDRGPYKLSKGKYIPHPTRLFDLSKAAFSSISNLDVGVIKIKYKIIYKP